MYLLLKHVDLSGYTNAFKQPIQPLAHWIVETGAEETDNVVYVKALFNNGREWIRQYITPVAVSGVNWRVLLKYLTKYFNRDILLDIWLEFVDSKINSIDVDQLIDVLEILYQNALNKHVCVFILYTNYVYL